MLVTAEERRRKHKLSKANAPFFPDSPQSVGSPRGDGSFRKRNVRERTPRKLCSLVLPPPLMSINDSAGGDPITTSTTDYQLPQHLRVGMTQCDPLLIFDGRFVLVATCDGRIAMYSIVDFDDTANGTFSEDVEASERRKRAEWIDEDTVHSSLHHQLQTIGNSRTDNMNASHHSQQVEEEESEWDVRDRMRRREDAMENVKPIIVLSLPRTSSHDEEVAVSVAKKFVTLPTIVAMCATKREGENPSSTIDTTNEQSAVDHSHNESLIGHVVVLTSDGDVHMIEFRNSPSPRSIDSQVSNEGRLVKHIPAVTIVLSFSTHCLEATCICMSQDLVHETLGESLQGQPSIRVCIGHESGILKAYQVSSLHNHEQQTSPTNVSPLKVEGHKRSPTAGDRITTEVIDAISLQRTRSAPIRCSESDVAHILGPPRAELCWMGSFDIPVRSLSSLGQSNDTACQSLLVVGLERREDALHQVSMNGTGPPIQHHSLSPALSLEVINIALADKLWSQMNNTTDSNANDTHCIRLHNCSVWPTPGKEIKDGWICGSSRRGIDPRDKLFASLRLQRTSVTNKICSFKGPDPCFVSAANDGTVIVAHAHSEDDSWGVMDEDNQIMLFQQCVGLGILDFDRTRRYIACCLRAGTIIIMPIAKSKTNNQIRTTSDNLIMFPVSMASNGDDDGFIHFVQSFTAGISRVTTWNANLDKEDNDAEFLMKPIAILGWPGGILDVYEIPTCPEPEIL